MEKMIQEDSCQINFIDSSYMRIALKEAEAAFAAGEVPVGAVLVYQKEVIAAAHNRVEELRDTSAHAEMLCMSQGARLLGNWRLLDTVLYSTLEPCPMCAGRMILSRIGTLVWGAPDLRQGADGSWVGLFDRPHPIHSLKIRRGVLAEECGELMRTFFQKRRKENGS
jgi:tRNA(adenine34) deaminase